MYDASKHADQQQQPAPPNYLWWIPLTYTTASKLDFSVTKPNGWLGPDEFTVITETGISANDWVLFNINETGFYRVNYDPTNWNMLIEYLNDPELYTNIGEYIDLRVTPDDDDGPTSLPNHAPPRTHNNHNRPGFIRRACAGTINRAQLVDDAMSLSRAGYLSYRTALDLTKYLYHETEYVPWKSAYRSFTYLHQMLLKTAVYDKLKVFICRLSRTLWDLEGYGGGR